MTEKVVYELSLRDLMTKGLNDINSKLDNFEKNIDKAGKATRKTEGAFQSIGGVWKALAATGIFLLGREVVNTAAKMEALDKSIIFASGSAQEGSNNLDFLKRITREMPIDLMAAKEGWKTFGGAVMGSSIEGEKARNIFYQVSKAASVMGLSAEDSKGMFLAMGQMVSKGTVQAEELKGQLGERLPGAFQRVAKAMNMTTRELGEAMKAGQITADVMLPKLANELNLTYSQGMAGANDTIQAHMIRLQNLKYEMIGGSIPAIKSMMGVFTDFAFSFMENSEPMVDLFNTWKNSISNLLEPIMELFGFFEGGNTMLFILKSIATVFQTMLLPAQIVMGIVGNIIDGIGTIVNIAGLAKSGEFGAAFDEVGNFKDRAVDRISNPFASYGKIWSDSGNAGATGGWGTENDLMSGIGSGSAGADEKLKKQASELSGGAPKVVNINVEALIKQVDNYFTGDRKTMEKEMEYFLDKLQKALNTLLVDTAIIGGNN